jgi:very-short-patch-repair endonuclease
MADYRNGAQLAGPLRQARALRRSSTFHENLLWKELRNRRLIGLKFRRQHPYEVYVLDFFCAEARLVVELDGDSHADPAQQRYDAERTALLESHGLRVVRIANRQLQFEREAALTSILRVVYGE